MDRGVERGPEGLGQFCERSGGPAKAHVRAAEFSNGLQGDACLTCGDHQRLGLIKAARDQVTALILTKEGRGVGCIHCDTNASGFGHLERSESQTTVSKVGARVDQRAVCADEIAVCCFCGQIDMRCIAVFAVIHFSEQSRLTEVASSFAQQEQT